jgi:hypothetical protein
MCVTFKQEKVFYKPVFVCRRSIRLSRPVCCPSWSVCHLSRLSAFILSSVCPPSFAHELSVGRGKSVSKELQQNNTEGIQKNSLEGMKQNSTEELQQKITEKQQFKTAAQKEQQNRKKGCNRTAQNGDK